LCFKWKKSKQSTWVGRGRIALLRKEESAILPGEEREEGEGMVGTGGVHQQRESVLFFLRCL
jgi:hypothetical protein